MPRSEGNDTAYGPAAAVCAMDGPESPDSVESATYVDRAGFRTLARRLNRFSSIRAQAKHIFLRCLGLSPRWYASSRLVSARKEGRHEASTV